jgi:hypothetical protein
MLLDRRGRPVSEREREKTPQPATPRRVLAVITELADRSQASIECRWDFLES